MYFGCINHTLIATAIIGRFLKRALVQASQAFGQSFPRRDSILSNTDVELGFDWTAMLVWFDPYPSLTEIGRYFYDSLAPQQLIVPLVLVLFRR